LDQLLERLDSDAWLWQASVFSAVSVKFWGLCGVRPNPGKGLADGYKPVFNYIGHLSGDMFIGGRRGG
jgi:hypothetical protein